MSDFHIPLTLRHVINTQSKIPPTLFDIYHQHSSTCHQDSDMPSRLRHAIKTPTYHQDSDIPSTPPPPPTYHQHNINTTRHAISTLTHHEHTLTSHQHSYIHAKLPHIPPTI
ncbi:hypothetical protein ElyMa_001809800 [Elysia marginata]|uniref:Uncharacterized protein n=1 Tax=Elysia marginata TaxID=1093978 RepID=A0AAV4EHN2_9GAST|nr:hypothetical protein ElyMa_001809800 [Elysia marginata]